MDLVVPGTLGIVVYGLSLARDAREHGPWI
jgi:hypothetical protein